MSGIRERQRGNTLIVIVGALALFIAMSGAFSALIMATSNSAEESDARMRAFYLADSGAQIANGALRASNGSATGDFTEDFADGTYAVSVTDEGSGIYSIQSTGTFDGIDQTVEMIMQISGNFSMNGAVEMTFGRGVEIEDTIPIRLGNTSVISGIDHNPDETVKADQSAATYGLSIHDLPGDADISVSQAAGATLEGTPDPTTNSAEDQSDIFQAVRDYARTNADVIVNGNKTFTDADTGSYGTALDPKLVYVRPNSEGLIRLRQNFTGYGTLVIDARGEYEDNGALLFEDFASWHGLVILRIGGEEVEVEGASLIRIQESAKIVGGLALNLRSEETEVEDGGKILNMVDSGTILYSSDLVKNAPGITESVDQTVTVTSYRKL